MEDRFEDIGISDDFMFGTVMRNPEYCKPFLETVLGIQIERIVYPSSQKVIDLRSGAKSVRLDVYAADDNHTVYNIEMQTSRNRSLPKRARYYQSMVDLNIMEKGKDYQYLGKSYIIFVCTFDLFGENRHIYTFENRCVQNLNLSLEDEAVKIFLNTKGTADDVSEEMKNLLNYIDGNAPSDTYTNKLDEEVRRICRDEDWRVDYMTLEMKFQEKFELGKEEGLALGKQQGLELGKQQGLELGKQQGLELGKQQGLELGKQQGLTLGKEEGKQQGLALGKVNTLIQLVHDGILTEADAAQRAEMTVEEFAKLI